MFGGGVGMHRAYSDRQGGGEGMRAGGRKGMAAMEARKQAEGVRLPFEHEVASEC